MTLKLEKLCECKTLVVQVAVDDNKFGYCSDCKQMRFVTDKYKKVIGMKDTYYKGVNEERK